MAYDWKKLEREDGERHDRAALSFGSSWLVIGIIGPVAGFLITGSYDWVGAVVWIAIALGALIPAALTLRKGAPRR